MPKQNFPPKILRPSNQLESSFVLARNLLEARDEDSAILASMRVCAEIVGSQGAAFIPLNEWKHSTELLQFGEAEYLGDSDWQAILSDPETRFTCRVCDRNPTGSDCVLFEKVSKDAHVFCISLRCEGREIGMISFFFSLMPSISEIQQLFLAEMVRLTDITLSNLRMRAQELDAARRVFSSDDLKSELVNLDSRSKEILEELQYKAVLDERTRLAREIHDGLAQTLAFLKLETARMQKLFVNGDFEKVPGMLQACYQTLSDAYLDARQAIDNLRVFPDKSLSDWIDITLADFKTLTGMTVEVSNVHLRTNFSPGVKAQVIRIIQEALTNIRKHAQASKVSFAANECCGEVVFEICDDGCGFEVEGFQPVSQYGLRSMKERAESVGAEFQIQSAPSTGTTVQFRVPLGPEVST
jgi:signal transduction histidine kinase